MATWQDGPAYAPRERPVGFAQPDRAVSLHQPSAPKPQPSATQAPLDFQPPTSSAQIGSTPPAPVRDPRQAFAVTTTSLTPASTSWGVSAWGSAHTSVTPLPATSWAADQPWQSPYAPPQSAQAHFPVPGTMQWFGAGAAESPPTLTVPVNWRTWLESIGLPGVIVLGLGALMGSLSVFCLALGFACVQVMRYRRRQARWVLVGAVALVLLIYLFGQLTGLDFGWDRPAQLACLGGLIGCGLVQFSALRAGDKPERTS